MVMHAVCMVLMVITVTAREILAHDDGDHRAGGSGRIGGVQDTLGYAAPLLRLLSYLV